MGDGKTVHADFVSIFSGQWPVLKLLPLHLAVMLVHLLPYLEQITASLAKTSECMSILTGVPHNNSHIFFYRCYEYNCIIICKLRGISL